jgi:hypothetical protein
MRKNTKDFWNEEFNHKVIGSGESPTSKQITWVKTIVDNQGVEKSYIGGHKGKGMKDT